MTPGAPAPPAAAHTENTGRTFPDRRALLKAGAAALATGAVRLRMPAPAGAQDAASPTADLCLLTPEQTEGQRVYDLGNGQWNVPPLRKLLEAILPQKSSFEDYEVDHEFPSIGRKQMLLNARQVQPNGGKEFHILLAFEDVTLTGFTRTATVRC